MDNLIKWLKENCTKVSNSKTSNSCYYIINGLTIRYSDHIIAKQTSDIYIIKTSDKQYICFCAYFSNPVIFKTTDNVVSYIKSYLTFCERFNAINSINTTKKRLETLLLLNNLDVNLKSFNETLINYIMKETYMNVAKLKSFLSTLRPDNSNTKKISEFLKIPVM